MLMAILFALAITGCKDPESETTTEIKVTTYAATEITATTAQTGGHVTITGEATVTELGLCWGTESNPTSEGQHLSTTATTEPFNCTLTELQPATLYHVRAYAVASSEYYYGDDLTFTTLEGSVVPTLPEGLMKGVFTVGADAYDRNLGFSVRLVQDYVE